MLMSAFCVNSILQINLEMSLIYMDILAYTISMYKKASGPLDTETILFILLLLID
jgi:hypothetical protein